MIGLVMDKGKMMANKKTIHINKSATIAVINRHTDGKLISTRQYNLSDKQAQRLFNAVYWFVSKSFNDGWTMYYSWQERFIF